MVESGSLFQKQNGVPSLMINFSQLEESKDNQVMINEDDDDEEINQLILTPEEKKLKTIIWNNLNREWIKEHKEKKRKQKEERKMK